MSIKTPDTSSLDFKNVYEPAEDSFLFLDSLEKELENIKVSKPTICVELGSGSGIISAGLSSVLGSSCFILSCDINKDACSATARTIGVNNVKESVDVVRTDSFSGLDLKNKVDLVLCNPPYVATSEEEKELGFENADIAASWAGGELGRSLTDKLIKMLPEILSASGIAMIVLEQCNHLEKVMAFAESLGLASRVVLQRRAGREFLSVIKLMRKI